MKICTREFSIVVLLGLVLQRESVQAASGPPVITNQPPSRTVLQDSSTTFTVGADGTTPFTFQWLKNGGVISSATGQSYTIASAQSSDEAAYSVRVMNSV